MAKVFWRNYGDSLQYIKRIFLTAFLSLACLASGAFAQAPQEAIAVTKEIDSIRLERNLKIEKGRSDRVQMSLPPGSDGISRRIEVKSKSGNQQAIWALLTLANNTDEQIDRLLVAPHYKLINSGLLSPDLGNRRIIDITPSQGFKPEKQSAIDNDVWQVTLDPGSSVTLIIELADSRIPEMTLWKPDSYKDRENAFTLYKGIVIGIAGLLALFLTTLFVVKGSLMFPAAALLAWAVLGYIGLDFGFWSRLLSIQPERVGLFRAAGESILAATLAVFLFAYLNLNRWHVRYSHLTAIWIGLMVGLTTVAFFIDPGLAASISRFALGTIALVGFGIVIYMSLHKYDRAVMIFPTWFLIVIWVIAMGLTVGGRILNDIAAPSLLGGLVLLIMLIGFTVTQHAFAGGALAQGILSDSERKALAQTGSGDYVWDWDVNTDYIYISPEIEHDLGLKKGQASGSTAHFLGLVKAEDRDKTRLALDTLLEHRRGRLHLEFRLRTPDNDMAWMSLRARPVIGVDGEVMRVTGTILDISESKIAEDRLTTDAVRDSLTALPNRILFMDRLKTALTLAKTDENIRPTVIVLDLDNFRKVNEAIGHNAADTLLLTLSRRLSRMLKPMDSLARVGGDEFALIILSEHEPQRITAFADLLRRALRAPIPYGDKEIFLTGSIGLALIDVNHNTAEDILKDAEFAAFYAKKQGGDRIQVFKPSMRAQRSDRLIQESDLRSALENHTIRLNYLPIVRLSDRTLAGFEVIPRWDHPVYGRLPLSEFMPLAETSGLILDLGLYLLEHSTAQLNYWQREAPTQPPIFINLNFSSNKLLKNEILPDIQAIMKRHPLIPDTLRLEFSEGFVMENPEHAAIMLAKLKQMKFGLALSEFGTGFSSLNYMQRLVIDQIKIHPSMIRSHDGKDRSPLVRSVLTMTHDLGLSAVISGIESENDIIYMSQLGCEFAQGQAFGDSLSPEEANHFLMDNKG
jgi:diguanylate cyclase (GGDEF)-like protein/PAS domain S-box-containing protein